MQCRVTANGSLCSAETNCHVVQRIHHNYSCTTTGRKYPSVVLQPHLAANSISIHALSASLSHNHYCKVVEIVKDSESAGSCSILHHQLIMFMIILHTKACNPSCSDSRNPQPVSNFQPSTVQAMGKRLTQSAVEVKVIRNSQQSLTLAFFSAQAVQGPK